MYFLYKELQKAIGAKYCCTCHFYNERTENIIACSSDTIVIYEVIQLSEVDPNVPSPFRLKVMEQYSFCGEILSIACIPLKVVSPLSTQPNRDAIILSFKGNYVSILAYNDQEGDLSNIECYDFNKEAAIALNRISWRMSSLYREWYGN